MLASSDTLEVVLVVVVDDKETRRDLTFACSRDYRM